MGLPGQLEKMVIKAYSDRYFHRLVGTFSVQINPEKYAQSYAICYSNVQAQGSKGPSPEFGKMSANTATFELVFDGTGVVAGALPGVSTYIDDGVAAKVEEFKRIVCGYDGKIHSPKFLELVWGTLGFKCRLTRLDLTYTLFEPDGTPLRARATAAFTSYTAPDELEREGNDNSPDLSHLVTVRAGETLPLLCYRIYGTSIYYRQVAEVNGLTDFRALAVGSQLLFPPLAGART